ncbi:hypothetical protein FF098_017105 [Parvularcula flava]|uniref:Uncharacterized protein n=1 Tax=Aquisalinus luteolus TaxID=1566827 RepID=A0A8J3A4J2_9PROT|nr:hypothetical protein [Aquisalinus luteolus]NHK29629.1 hypothetical protein [Aquisalinus luteolus]GGI02285.1 hypothetical protein GCM10011355_34930 [Aquisalinus luteolus]
MLAEDFAKSVNQEAFDKFNEGLVLAARSGHSTSKSLLTANMAAEVYDTQTDTAKKEKDGDISLQLAIEELRQQQEEQLAALMEEYEMLREQQEAGLKLRKLLADGKFDRDNGEHMRLAALIGVDTDQSNAEMIEDNERQLSAVEKRAKEIEKEISELPEGPEKLEALKSKNHDALLEMGNETSADNELKVEAGEAANKRDNQASNTYSAGMI